eukprot:gene11073-18680_t
MQKHKPDGAQKRVKPPLNATVQPKCSTLQDLCPEDKQKVAKLLRQVVDLGQDNERLKEEAAKDGQALNEKLSNLSSSNEQLVQENTGLKSRLTQMIVVLRTQQHRLVMMDTALRHSMAAGKQAETAEGAHQAKPAADTDPVQAMVCQHQAATSSPSAPVDTSPSQLCSVYPTDSQAGQSYHLPPSNKVGITEQSHPASANPSSLLPSGQNCSPPSLSPASTPASSQPHTQLPPSLNPALPSTASSPRGNPRHVCAVCSAAVAEAGGPQVIPSAPQSITVRAAAEDSGQHSTSSKLQTITVPSGAQVHLTSGENIVTNESQTITVPSGAHVSITISQNYTAIPPPCTSQQQEQCASKPTTAPIAPVQPDLCSHRQSTTQGEEVHLTGAVGPSAGSSAWPRATMGSAGPSAGGSTGPRAAVSSAGPSTGVSQPCVEVKLAAAIAAAAGMSDSPQAAAITSTPEMSHPPRPARALFNNSEGGGGAGACEGGSGGAHRNTAAAGHSASQPSLPPPAQTKPSQAWDSAAAPAEAQPTQGTILPSSAPSEIHCWREREASLSGFLEDAARAQGAGPSVPDCRDGEDHQGRSRPTQEGVQRVAASSGTDPVGGRQHEGEFSGRDGVEGRGGDADHARRSSAAAGGRQHESSVNAGTQGRGGEDLQEQRYNAAWRQQQLLALKLKQGQVQHAPGSSMSRDGTGAPGMRDEAGGGAPSKRDEAGGGVPGINAPGMRDKAGLGRAGIGALGIGAHGMSDEAAAWGVAQQRLHSCVLEGLSSRTSEIESSLTDTFSEVRSELTLSSSMATDWTAPARGMAWAGGRDSGQEREMSRMASALDSLARTKNWNTYVPCSDPLRAGRGEGKPAGAAVHPHSKPVPTLQSLRRSAPAHSAAVHWHEHPSARAASPEASADRCGPLHRDVGRSLKLNSVGEDEPNLDAFALPDRSSDQFRRSRPGGLAMSHSRFGGRGPSMGLNHAPGGGGPACIRAVAGRAVAALSRRKKTTISKITQVDEIDALMNSHSRSTGDTRSWAGGPTNLLAVHRETTRAWPGESEIQDAASDVSWQLVHDDGMFEENDVFTSIMEQEELEKNM